MTLNPLTNELLYRRPAERFTEASPIGSGRLGAMIYGRINEERLSLNEETIWMGTRQDRSNPRARAALPEIRRLLFEGRIREAEAMARDSLVSKPKKFGAYTPFADLMIRESDETWREGIHEKYYEYENYERRVSLSEGIVTLSYTKNGVRYFREYFASYPDNVIVVHIDNDKQIPMDLDISFMYGPDPIGHADDLLTLTFRSTLCENGVSFCGALRVLADCGTAQTNKHVSDPGYMPPLTWVRRASGITLFLAIRTDFDGGDPSRCLEDLDAAMAKGYRRLREDHIRDFSSEYSRFSLTLHKEHGEARDTLQLLDDAHRGNISPAFAELVMNTLRYLFISASRKGCQPSNLQGVWNDQRHVMWESDYHTNVNLQINYWPAHAWGLHDCVEPLLDWIEALLPSGTEAVQRLYGTRGWTVHHASDLFGYATPLFDVVGIWPLGGPWLCRHLYDYYLHTGNEDMLRTRLYPIMKGCAEFLLDFLVTAPENSECPGALVTSPSVSPENIYILPGGESGMLTYAPTMDIELVEDFFALYIDTLTVLRRKDPTLDTDLLSSVWKARASLPPVRVSSRTGGIAEWIGDFEEEDPGHRHVSHLFGVYPGWSISPDKTPALAAAAQKTIDRKFSVGYHGQGWCLGWIAAIEARLMNGEGAYDAMKRILREQLLPNMMVNSHGHFQVGDAMALPAAMLETLAQSHTEEIILLPCLPSAWPDGEIRGMSLRGGYTLSMEWKEGALLGARLTKSFPGERKAVRVGVPGRYKITEDKVSGDILVEAL